MGLKKQSTINRLENFSRTSGGHPNIEEAETQQLEKTSAEENKEVSQKSPFILRYTYCDSVRMFHYTKPQKKIMKKCGNPILTTCKAHSESRCQEEVSKCRSGILYMCRGSALQDLLLP